MFRVQGALSMNEKICPARLKKRHIPIHTCSYYFFLIQNSYFTDDPPENVSVELGKSNCVHVQWGGLSPEKFAAFDGYRVFYALFRHPKFSLNKTVNASTHWVEICNLESSMKYKFYVQRILRTDMGNASDVKYFTTERRK